MLVCMFTTLHISDFTELNPNKHTFWMDSYYCCFPSPPVIKTHYVESSAVLLCFPSVHTVLGIPDNTADGNAISASLVLLQWDFMWPLVEKFQWFWLKIFHFIDTCQISKFSRSCHWLESAQSFFKRIFNPFPIYNTSILWSQQGLFLENISCASYRENHPCLWLGRR